MLNWLHLCTDISRAFQIGFQDSATPVMSSIIDLHSHISFFLIIILILVIFQILDILRFFRIDYYFFI